MEADPSDAMTTYEAMEQIRWNSTFEVHSRKCCNPTVADVYFTTGCNKGTTHKPRCQSFQMSELGIYKVDYGKITVERFFYQRRE